MHLGRIERYSHALSMRRVCSILTLLAVLYPMATPLWASAMDEAQPTSCHRMPMRSETVSQANPHHCHDMDDSAAAATPDEGKGASLTASSHSEKCPMNCCTQVVPRTAAALHSSSLLPLPSAAEVRPLGVALAFTSAGFSSHTDRGPPTV